MRLSPAAELAVRSMLILAEEHGRGPVTLTTICRRRALPRQYLVKILSTLAKAGLVTAIRGKNGGYKLAKAPEQITVLEIIETIEGRIALNYCQQEPSQCDQTSCPVRPVWTDFQNLLRHKLGETTLADCVAHTA